MIVVNFIRWVGSVIMPSSFDVFVTNYAACRAVSALNDWHLQRLTVVFRDFSDGWCDIGSDPMDPWKATDWYGIPIQKGECQRFGFFRTPLILIGNETIGLPSTMSAAAAYFAYLSAEETLCKWYLNVHGHPSLSP